LWTICSGWLWTVIFLISASSVARITGMSHQHLATMSLEVQSLCFYEIWISDVFCFIVHAFLLHLRNFLSSLEVFQFWILHLWSIFIYAME
jgi:hypothetical protein